MMNKPNKMDAVLSIVGSNKHFSISPSGVFTWLESNDDGKPTEKAIQAELKKLEDEYQKQAYARARASEYPTIEELVVALYDVEDRQKIVERRTAVKAKYPKPE